MLFCLPIVLYFFCFDQNIGDKINLIMHMKQVLLQRFQITHNLALDGVLDLLNSKNMTEAGPLDLIDDDNSDTEEGIDKQTRGNMGYNLPGSMPNCGRAVIRTKCLKIAPTGRSFSAATTEGVLVYSIDESFIFDPTDLDIDVTPEVLSFFKSFISFTKFTNYVSSNQLQ